MSGGLATDEVTAKRDLTEILREMTMRVPGVWTYSQLWAGLVTCGGSQSRIPCRSG
jgi:hypothetical protein